MVYIIIMVSVTIASSSSGMEQPTAVVSKETTTTTASTSLDESPEESLSSNAFPPPSHNDYYSYYVLPKCNLPPASEYTPVETFVYQTIQEQTQQCHETTSTTTANTTSSSMPPVVLTTAYKTLLEALKQTTDPKLLTNILLALRTSGNGATLHLLAANASKHARLIHTLVRLHPFEKKENRWNKESRETDNDDNNNNNSDDAYLYSVADAHLHLLLALVSANSVFLIPTLTTLWKLLALEYEEDVTEARYVVYTNIQTRDDIHNDDTRSLVRYNVVSHKNSLLPCFSLHTHTAPIACMLPLPLFCDCVPRARRNSFPLLPPMHPIEHDRKPRLHGTINTR